MLHVTYGMSKERNYDRAKEALRSHIENTRDDMISILEQEVRPRARSRVIFSDKLDVHV
jgi:hypothetical protein